MLASAGGDLSPQRRVAIVAAPRCPASQQRYRAKTGPGGLVSHALCAMQVASFKGRSTPVPKENAPVSTPLLDCSDLDDYMGKPMQPARMVDPDTADDEGDAVAECVRVDAEADAEVVRHAEDVSRAGGRAHRVDRAARSRAR